MKWWKYYAPPFVRETVIRERRKHASGSPVPTAFTVRAVKTKPQETITNRRMFFVLAIDAEKNLSIM